MSKPTTKPIFIITVTLILSSLLVLAALISPGVSSRAAINTADRSAVSAGETKPAATPGVVTTPVGSAYTAGKGEPTLGTLDFLGCEPSQRRVAWRDRDRDGDAAAADRRQQASRAVELTQEGTEVGKMARTERDRLVIETKGTNAEAPPPPSGTTTQPPSR